jgi:hypothetical protein
MAGILGRQLHFKRKGVQKGKAIEIMKGCGADVWVNVYEKERASTS